MTPHTLNVAALLTIAALALATALVTAFERARARSLARGWDVFALFVAGVAFAVVAVVAL